MPVRTALIAGVLLSTMLLGGRGAAIGTGGPAESISVQDWVTANFAPAIAQRRDHAARLSIDGRLHRPARHPLHSQFWR